MKKTTLILLSVATILAMTACGSRKSNKNAKSGDQSEQATEMTTKAQKPEDKSLEGTKWRFNDSFDDLTSVEYLMEFSKGGQCEYTIQYFNRAGGKEKAGSGHYVGTYTFDGRNGELDLKCTDSGDSFEDGHIRLQDEKHLLVKYGSSKTLIKQ